MDTGRNCPNPPLGPLWPQFLDKEREKGSFQESRNWIALHQLGASVQTSLPETERGGMPPLAGAVMVSSSPLRFRGGIPDVEERSRARCPTKPQAAQTPALKGHPMRETRTYSPGSSAPEQDSSDPLLHTGHMAGCPEMAQDEHVSGASQVQSGF